MLPLLLLIDGHKAHYNPDFIREAAKHGVIIFCLPPNTTHVSQPLDSTCFHSLKRFWIEACDNYMCSNPGKVVTIYQFSELFASAFVKAVTVSSWSISERQYPYQEMQDTWHWLWLGWFSSSWGCPDNQPII